MEGIGGKYENEYAIKYTVNSEGKISNIREWLSDIFLATQLYGQPIEGVHIIRKRDSKWIRMIHYGWTSFILFD